MGNGRDAVKASGIKVGARQNLVVRDQVNENVPLAAPTSPQTSPFLSIAFLTHFPRRVKSIMLFLMLFPPLLWSKRCYTRLHPFLHFVFFYVFLDQGEKTKNCLPFYTPLFLFLFIFLAPTPSPSSNPRGKLFSFSASILCHTRIRLVTDFRRRLRKFSNNTKIMAQS